MSGADCCGDGGCELDRPLDGPVLDALMQLHGEIRRALGLADGDDVLEAIARLRRLLWDVSLTAEGYRVDMPATPIMPEDFDPLDTDANEIVEAVRDVVAEAGRQMTRAEAAEAEAETLRMQVVACGTLALMNTRESLAKWRKIHPDYDCAMVQDVIRGVEREIAEREAKETAEAEAARLREMLDMVHGRVFDLLDYARGCKPAIDEIHAIREYIRAALAQPAPAPPACGTDPGPPEDENPATDFDACGGGS